LRFRPCEDRLFDEIREEVVARVEAFAGSVEPESQEEDVRPSILRSPSPALPKIESEVVLEVAGSEELGEEEESREVDHS